jgi:hypothetical protein
LEADSDAAQCGECSGTYVQKLIDEDITVEIFAGGDVRLFMAWLIQ